eukprot:TRINITY_DN634_c0_g1_i2.p1 TRINITY_DN634_c0_g1~~TRINITY_DN634_c0_g1_i2.p1  ORF type:complete len:448 (-),score=123.12 TRINITY_DN634_c0_g1_i2:694-2037(-)
MDSHAAPIDTTEEKQNERLSKKDRLDLNRFTGKSTKNWGDIAEEAPQAEHDDQVAPYSPATPTTPSSVTAESPSAKSSNRRNFHQRPSYGSASSGNSKGGRHNQQQQQQQQQQTHTPRQYAEFEVQISNLPAHFTEASLVEYLAGVGCTVLGNPRLRSMRDSEGAKSAFVDVADRNSFDAALKLHEQEIDGHKIDVRNAPRNEHDRFGSRGKHSKFESKEHHQRGQEAHAADSSQPSEPVERRPEERRLKLLPRGSTGSEPSATTESRTKPDPFAGAKPRVEVIQPSTQQTEAADGDKEKEKEKENHDEAVEKTDETNGEDATGATHQASHSTHQGNRGPRKPRIKPSADFRFDHAPEDGEWERGQATAAKPRTDGDRRPRTDGAAKPGKKSTKKPAEDEFIDAPKASGKLKASLKATKVESNRVDLRSSNPFDALGGGANDSEDDE